MSKKPLTASSIKEGLHSRNRHRAAYDFKALVAAYPGLELFVKPNPFGNVSIDFANPKAVMALNRALLAHFYGITRWTLPLGYLCPPIPGRADYIHHVADLLSGGKEDKIPRGPTVSVLEIGIGANCVYPIVGRQEYGWSFVGTDIDELALDSAEKIISQNSSLKGFVECRHQKHPRHIFKSVLKPDERFAVSVCNPPFHSSAAEAQEGTLRKLRNLAGRKISKPVLNFGGQRNELWCHGGELTFVKRMIAESAELPDACHWFTSLVSKSSHIPELEQALKAVKPTQVKIIDMAQGQKKSRLLAWSFR